MIIAIFILLAFCLVEAYYLLKFGKKILNLQDAIEESLDIFDRNYKVLHEISEKPIFFDSIEVRQAIDAIKNSKDGVLVVANLLVDSINTQDEDEDSEKEND